MKNSFVYVLISLVILGLISCGKEDNSSADINLNPINLGDLQVGQKSFYSFFMGEGYSKEDRSFDQTTDTLVVEVMEDLGNNSFRIKEQFTNPSADLVDRYGDDAFAIKDLTWTISNDSLKIDNSAEGFAFLTFGVIGFDLNDFEDQELEMNEWTISSDIEGFTVRGYLENIEINGGSYDRLNGLVLNLAMTIDGAGMGFVYSKEIGFVNTSIYSPWTDTGSGFNLIP